MRQSAEARREAVVAAALVEFAHNGYKATTTEVIARRVGVSQPYLFRLFPSKHAIFLAAAVRCMTEIEDAFRAVEKPASPLTLRDAFLDLLDGGKEVLSMFQLQAWAAARNDPEVREVCQTYFLRHWRVFQELTGGGNRQTRMHIAEGVLLNVLVAIDLPLAPAELNQAVADLDVGESLQQQQSGNTGDHDQPEVEPSAAKSP